MQRRILVIDDDRLVAAAIRRTLEREYVIVIEHDPRMALRLLRSGASFDLVLCDMIMPMLSGVQLRSQLATTHPELASRFVFLTGVVDDPPDPRFPRIEKPFTLDSLRQAVSDLLSDLDAPVP